MHHVVVVLRNPMQPLDSAQNFAFFIYLSRHMKLTAALYPNEKMKHLGDGGKKLSKDLAVTPENISWCLNPDF